MLVQMELRIEKSKLDIYVPKVSQIDEFVITKTILLPCPQK